VKKVFLVSMVENGDHIDPTDFMKIGTGIINPPLLQVTDFQDG